MKTTNLLRTVSILSYLLIILAGQMMGIPFFCWLSFTVLDFGNIDQVFALLGIVGVLLNFTTWKDKFPIMALSFIMMLSPLISRMLQVPIKVFNYPAFKIPLAIFMICYLALIILNAKKRIISETID